MQSSNPIITNKIALSATDSKAARMTINGTVLKSMTLVGLLACSSIFVWMKLKNGNIESIQMLLKFSTPITFVLGWITFLKPKWSRFTAPIYAVSQGVLVGFFSSIAERVVPGIISQAIPLTISVLCGMLLLYLTGLVRVTRKLQTIILGGILTVALTYAVEWIISFFGVRVPYIHETGPIGILISLVMVILASFTLLLDFEAIRINQESGAPGMVLWVWTAHFLGMALR